MASIASVIIPAHDEEAVIGRCLATLLDSAEPDEFEVIVVANGCSDRTVAVSRAAAPQATVLDLDAASKVDALNAGDQVATCFPRAYLDADVEVSPESMRKVVAVLETGGALCAAPQMELQLADRPWFVRSFFRTFLRLPYASDGLVGNGIYVLSRAGRERFGDFPAITADDLFVRNLFTSEERAAVPATTFRVHPPRRFSGLLAIRERSYRGNAEYHRLGFTSSAEPTRDHLRLITTMLRHPVDTAVYLATNLLAVTRLRFRRHEVRWERDESARR